METRDDDQNDPSGQDTPADAGDGPESSDDLGPTAQVVVQKNGAGGSQAFRVAATDGKTYWCKPLNNPRGPRSQSSSRSSVALVG